MATHRSLKVTFWTRTWDLLKGILLYGTFNWRRASDGLQPPKLSPGERRQATPSKDLEVIKPRHNPKAALIKTLPKKPAPSKVKNVTAGAIVSDPLLEAEGGDQMHRHSLTSQSETEEAELAEEEVASTDDDQVIVRRRRRKRRHGFKAKHAPRSGFQLADSAKPGLLARLFGAK